MILSIECSYSYTDDRRAYFNFDEDSAQASYEKLTRAANGAKSCFSRRGFSVPKPKNEFGEIGGARYKAMIRVSVRKFASKLSHNSGEMVSYMSMSLVDLQKL